jgi:hypothetical protein
MLCARAAGSLIFIKSGVATHGEPVVADALRHRIEEQMRWSCRVPDDLETDPLPQAPGTSWRQQCP